MIVIPMMQKNIYTSAHHAKFGKPLGCCLMEMMDETKAMSHASCRAVSKMIQR